jgi:hypothetical protein
MCLKNNLPAFPHYLLALDSGKGKARVVQVFGLCYMFKLKKVEKVENIKEETNENSFNSN